jgi:lipopolysaccharide export LptBFGC system permease protein LptF
MTMTTKAFLITIALLCAALLFFIFDNIHLNSKIAEKQAEIISLAAANQEFKTSVAQQNTAIDLLKADEEHRQKEADDAVAIAKQQAKSHDQEISTLRKTVAHGTDCEASNALLTTYLRRSKQ